MMKLVTKFSLLLVLFITAFNSFATERKPIEKPTKYGYINDYAGILSTQEQENLFQKLKDYEDSTSSQIAIVIEQTLNNRDPFDRAMDYARGWEVGQKGKNNGVVLYFAIEERKIFIMPASHTQGVLTDGISGQIIRNYISPNFKNGDYNAGINAGVDQIIAALAGEFTNDGRAKKEGSILPFLLFLGFIILIFYLSGKNGGGNGGGYNRRGTYWFPGGHVGGGGGGWSGGGGGGGFGGFGGGGGFNGGGAGGGW